MRSTLLVPLDGMPVAESALPTARVLADALGARLELVRVVAPDACGTAEADALAYLHRFDLTDEDLRRVARGIPGECLVREAASEHVKLMVMTTHARSGLRRMVLGSVAEYVVAHAAAPTVLIRAGMQYRPRLANVLVAMDSACAAPLPVLVEIAAGSGARLTLLHVVSPDDTVIWQWQPGPALDEPQIAAKARRDLEDLAAGLAERGVGVHARIQVGPVAATINAVADEVNADLIAVATHARNGAERTILGSVTDSLVHTARRPLLISRLIPMRPRHHN
jgi:nucleotide-binding universal stress UspA family protein